MGPPVSTVAWLLNLDAELELANPGRPEASSRLQSLVAHHGSRFLASVDASGRSAGFSHAPAASCPSWDHLLAWCPTPGALRSVDGLASELAPPPSLDVLQKVNHRGFLVELTEGLPGSIFATSMDQLSEHLRSSPAPPRGWLLKRAFGFSGRWRKHITDLDDTAIRRWCESSMRDYGGGLQVEPNVSILEEFTLHGLLYPDGSVLRGNPTRLHSDARGAWVGNQTLDEELSTSEYDCFEAALSATTTALHDAGYSGPFGIDGFRWQDIHGRPRWQALSDLNARFTMGYFVGMHQHHREVVETCDLSGVPGEQPGGRRD